MKFKELFKHKEDQGKEKESVVFNHAHCTFAEFQRDLESFPERRSMKNQYGIWLKSNPPPTFGFELFDEIHGARFQQTWLVRGLLEDDNLSTLKAIHTLTGQVLLGQGDLSYPMNWVDLHRIVELVILTTDDDTERPMYRPVLDCLQSIKFNIQSLSRCLMRNRHLPLPAMAANKFVKYWNDALQKVSQKYHERENPDFEWANEYKELDEAFDKAARQLERAKNTSDPDRK
ncbi:MAG: hypothetical protein Q9212_004812 [Teloschistes hypoglaucus]